MAATVESVARGSKHSIGGDQQWQDVEAFCRIALIQTGSVARCPFDVVRNAFGSPRTPIDKNLVFPGESGPKSQEKWARSGRHNLAGGISNLEGCGLRRRRRPSFR